VGEPRHEEGTRGIGQKSSQSKVGKRRESRYAKSRGGWDVKKLVAIVMKRESEIT
jgi:hypothetical protein